MTAVGAIAGLGLASGELNRAIIGEIFAWWVLSPIIGFWMAVMIGRYWYRQIDRFIAIQQSEGPLITIEQAGALARPVLGPNTTWREVVGTGVLVSIGCLMAFSSGTSNIANAIAPLVGSGALAMNPAILIGCGAVAVGALTIARRTMETLGNDITDLPLTAAIIVAVLSSTIVIILSALGIPASFVVVATVCIVGLGWGRSTHAVSIGEAVRGEVSPEVSLEALTAEGDPARRRTDPADASARSASRRFASTETTSAAARSDLFDPGTTVRVILMQNVVPIFATVGSYLTFSVLNVV
jgi:PiT family inorganic phosphate transporter